MAEAEILSQMGSSASNLEQENIPTENGVLIPTVLLSDKEIQEFLVNGYIVKKCSLPKEFHTSIHSQMIEKESGKWGNNITSAIPDLTKIWNDDPVIKGALTSLLGPNFDCQGHRHLHHSHPGFQDQGLHRDSHWGYALRRSPRPRRVMAMYYCQDITQDMGPTGIVPKSHYFSGTGKKERFLSVKESVPKDWPGCHEIKMTGDAGRLCIIDFDLWHRGSANISNINRYMLKMQFIRNVEPDTPSWDCKTTDWLLDEIDSSRKHLVLDSWHWMLGESGNGLSLPTSEIPFDELQRDMFNDKATRFSAEINRLKAATHLASLKDFDTLKNAAKKKINTPVEKNAAFGMILLGKEFASEIEAFCLEEHENSMKTDPEFNNQKPGRKRGLPPADERSYLRARLAFVLGEVGGEAQYDTLEKLALNDRCALVQRDASEALGHVVNASSTKQVQEKAINALFTNLTHPIEQVRMISARSLRQLQIKGVDLGSFRNKIAKRMEKETDSRYAREIMNRIVHHDVYTIHQLDTYICPLTTKGSQW